MRQTSAIKANTGHDPCSFLFRLQGTKSDRISKYRSTALFLTVVFPWSKFRQAKIYVRNYVDTDHSNDQDQDQDSLLVKRRNDNHSPGSASFLYWTRRSVQCPLNRYKIAKNSVRFIHIFNFQTAWGYTLLSNQHQHFWSIFSLAFV